MKTFKDGVMEELRTREPCDAMELNIWLQMRFTVFEAPSRAYFELPVGEKVERRSHVLASWIGAEQQCVSAARSCFASTYRNKDEFEDRRNVLFIRRWAEYQPPHYAQDTSSWEHSQEKPRWILVSGRLTIRFSLWDAEMTSHIGAIFPIKQEGLPI